MSTPKIAPSLLAADFSRLGEEVKRIVAAGADMLHFDVMDGEFVPNFAISPPFMAAVREITDVPFDVHIMVMHPLRYIDALAAAGADLITFHIESADKPSEVISAIRSHGLKPGLALCPKTPISTVTPYLSDVDLVLPMSVEPGFGGQPFQQNTLKKIAALHQMVQEMTPPLDISVDGGVTTEIAPLTIHRGATILVAGTAIFGSQQPETIIQKLRTSATYDESL
ncbi:MAG: ribulose-phosphate 3-epimerase [Candidatus Poribacteria bacterium]|nr:ribulose-phosphate 3-epimerase [Candidatus Poribacteria bacterium]